MAGPQPRHLGAVLTQCLEGIGVNTQPTQGNASDLGQETGLLIFPLANVTTK